MTTTPQRFTKCPITIEAIQLTQANSNDLAEWCGGRIVYTHRAAFEIHTLEGVMEAREGDWIIRGVQGEFYPCKPDIFEATYRPAAEHHEPPNTEPTDAEVRAAARAMFDVADEQMHFPTKFDRAPEPLADTYRRMARAALVAAREVSRHE